eukprot:g4256.t1
MATDTSAAGDGDGSAPALSPEESLKQLLKKPSVSVDENTFIEAMTGFDGVLRMLQAQGGMGEFKTEFERLHKMIKKQFEDEKTVVHDTTEAIKETEEKLLKITTLKRTTEEMERKSKMAEADIMRAEAAIKECSDAEEIARTSLNKLKFEIGEIEKELEVGPGLTKAQKVELAALEEARDQKVLELQTVTQNLTNARNKTSGLSDHVAAKARDLSQAEEEAKKYKAEVEACEKATEVAQKRKDRLDKQLQGLRKQVEGLQKVVQEKTVILEEKRTANDTFETKHKIAEQQIGVFLKEYDALLIQIKKTEEQVEERIHTNDLLKQGNERRTREVKLRQKEVSEIAREIKRVRKLKKVALKRLEEAKKDVKKNENRKADLHAKIKGVQAAIAVEEKLSESLRKTVDQHVRERSFLNQKLTKEENATKKTFDLVKVTQNTIKNLKNEIETFKAQARLQRAQIESLEVEREKYEKECDLTNQRYYAALEDVKLHELQVQEQQKKIAEGEQKIKLQQNLYEQVRSDRNLYSKMLIESQEVIAEMKRKFKIMNRQIDQLKEEITSKDKDLVKEHFATHKVQKQVEVLRNDITKVRKQIHSSEQIIDSQHDEMKKLNAIIQEADGERISQTKEFTAVTNERDLLGAQLIGRNEELSKLYEKIKIQRSTLSKGEWQYAEKEAECEALQEAISIAQERLNYLKGNITDLSSMRVRQFKLEKQILKEKAKATALSLELERPMNVHRWRKLAGSDPKKFALIQKIQRQQKALIDKTEEVVERDLLIQEKEKLYVELKSILARQPGPEVAEQLSAYEDNLKQKRSQKKKMENELAMYRHQVSELRNDIEKISIRMSEIKEEYFKKMRAKERKERQEMQMQKYQQQQQQLMYQQQAHYNKTFKTQMQVELQDEKKSE